MATATPDVPFFDSGRLKGHGKTLGVIGILVIAQLFIIVGIADNSPLLPGNFQPYEYAIALYIGIFALCLGMLAYTGALKTLLGMPATGFMLRMALWGAATWVVLTLLFSFGSSVSPILGSERVQLFILDAVFVAPVEELAFRVTFPAVLPGGWFMWSVVGFALFHSFAYAVTYGASLSQFAPELVVPGVMGAVLWFVYRLGPKGQAGKWGGYAGCLAVHLVYDLFVLGVISGLPLALAHLGLVPI